MTLDMQQCTIDHIKDNKSFEFVKLYKSAAETKETEHETSKTKKVKKINKNSVSEPNTPKPSRSPNKSLKKKNNETLNLSHIEAVGHNPQMTRIWRKSSSTSTPNSKNEQVDNSVKSIMKNKPNNMDSQLNISNVSSSSSKPKKRNKSVSFMLDDTEEVVLKKSKANNSNKEHKSKEKDVKNIEKKAETKIRKQKKSSQHSKEIQNLNEDMECSNKENVTSEKRKKKVRECTPDKQMTEEGTSSGTKKKVKKDKTPTPDSEKHSDIKEDNVTRESRSESKSRKLKKKKRKVKSIEDGSTDRAEGEPAVKTRKKDIKPEIIAKGLENLNIGDNAHTLTNLLDEMTVVDKNAKKRERQRQKRNALKKALPSGDKPKKVSEQETTVEEKEKVKWSNRKWNKDVKSDGMTRLHTSVVVENLPIKIMCLYKKLLSEHFSKFGTIAGIGVAEAYPTEDLKPVFTTTVFFQDEEAVAKVLEEDNSMFEGSRIRIRRPRPPSETTLVVRAFGLTDQALSSVFSAAGRLRTIRHVVKGNKSMQTAFVEFDGPEAVERALKMAEDTKINGKKMYVSKFEIRSKKKPNPFEKNLVNGNDNDSSTE